MNVKYADIYKKHNKKMSRHPVTKKTQKPTDRHTSISCGTREWQILQYLLFKKNERFNKCQCARDLNIPRSSVYEVLNRLVLKGYAKIPYYGNAVITKKGITIINAYKGGVGTSARGCREKGVGKLSHHYSKFTMKIKKIKDNFIRKAKSMSWYHKKVYMKNWEYDLFKINEDSISINPHTVVVRIHEIIAKDTEETMFQAVIAALDYVDKLKQIGITGQGFSYDGGHYARIDSYLSKFLSKIDNKYFLRLKDGSAFWLDNSHGLEDETDNINVRDNIDYNMHQLSQDKFNINMMKSELSDLKDIAKEHTTQFHILFKLHTQPNFKPSPKQTPPNYIY